MKQSVNMEVTSAAYPGSFNCQSSCPDLHRVMMERPTSELSSVIKF